MCNDQTAGKMLAETAALSGTAAGRARALLEVLREVVAYDGAWLGTTDPAGRGHRCLARTGPDMDVPPLRGPWTTRAVDVGGPGCAPSSPVGAPAPGQQVESCRGRSLITGAHETLALTRLVSAGRDVGVLALRFAGRQPPSDGLLHALEGLAPIVAHSIDPLRPVLAAVQLVPGARAGALLTDAGGCSPLPGMPLDPLLAPGSPVITTARAHIQGGAICSSFLWPVTGARLPGSHARITVLAAPAGAPPGSLAVAASAPATGLKGLSRRELAVLGLLVEGCSNHEIAHALVIAPRTAAAHVEHILRKLDAPTRTLAAVRAERNGLYTPVTLWRRDVHSS